MPAPTYIFAGGGTGGHLYPALAVAQELLRAQPAAKLVFACSRREIDQVVLGPTPYAVVRQPILPLPRSLTKAPAFLRAWIASRKLAREMVRDLKPAAVLGLGGFAAAPVVRQAQLAAVPAAMLNPDAVPGKANQYLAARVEAIFTQFDSTRETFAARHRHKVQAVGCPVRQGIAGASREAAVAEFGLLPDRRTLLVAGGSLGAESINSAIDAIKADLESLGSRWQLLHVAGPTRQPPARPPDATLHVRTLAYCHRMDLAYAAADVVLCRGGAVTVAELGVAGKPAVIMPYPYHADQQQKLNAGELAAAGACVVCDDKVQPAVNAAALRQTLLPILADEARLAAMTSAAGACGKPHAAAAVAQWLLRAQARG